MQNGKLGVRFTLLAFLTPIEPLHSVCREIDWVFCGFYMDENPHPRPLSKIEKPSISERGAFES
jgi:hypothetical protein